MAIQFYPLRVKKIIRETPETVSIVFQLPEDLKKEFSYRAGQYLTIKKSIRGEETRRSYSISSSMEWEEDLQVSSKVVKGGKMSTYLFNELSEGDTLEVMPPMGNFVVNDRNAPLVLFAAGSGITPVFSILKEALKKGDQLIHLYFGNRSPEQVIFKSELQSLAQKFSNRLLVQHFYSSEGERLDTDRTKSLLNGLQDKELKQAHFYICGPSGMIESVNNALKKADIPTDRIHVEYFLATSEQEEPKAEAAAEEDEDAVSGDLNQVHVTLDGETHQLSLEPGEAILDAASRIGIDPPFSCQSGVCTTCKAKLLSGEVEMENNFGLGDDEIEDGYVLTCIGKPKSPGVEISWDDV